MKDFLKPTKVKILITILFPLYIGMVVETASIFGSGEIVQSWRFTFLPFLALFFGAIAIWITQNNFFSALAEYTFGQSAWYFFLEILLPLIINYLLACLIVYLFNYFREKKMDAAEKDRNKDLQL